MYKRKCYKEKEDEEEKRVRKHYKVVLNIEITDPEQPYPAGGDYAYLSLIKGVTRNILWANRFHDANIVNVSLDKILDKGETYMGQTTPEDNIKQTPIEPLNTKLLTYIEPTTMKRLQAWHDSRPQGQRLFPGSAVNEALRDWLQQNGF